MALMLKRMHDLATLTVTVLPPERESPATTAEAKSSTYVEFQLQRRAGDDIEVSDKFKCPAHELGIPRHLTWEKVLRRGTYQFAVPTDFQDWLKAQMGRAELDERALWIHLVKPYGYLGLFPWERLLAPLCDCAILRLPDFLVDPPKQTSTAVDAAVCCLSGTGNAEARAALAARVTSVLASGAQRQIRLVLLVDSQIKKHMPQELPSGCAIHVYEGTAASRADTSFFSEYVANPFSDYVASPFSDYVASPFSDYVASPFKSYVANPVANTVKDWLNRKREQDLGQDLLSNVATIAQAIDSVKSPFLRWVRKTLGTRSVDLVHVIADSTLYLERGALLLDLEGTSTSTSGGHLVSSAEMLSFQAQVGAWAIGLSSPPDNFSDIGLRQFADTLAQLRPGPLIYHDATIDPECADLRAAYAFLLSARPADPPRACSTFMYCEPFRVRDRQSPDATFESLSEGSVVAEAMLPEQETLRAAFQQTDNVPSWVAATERFADLYKQRLAELSRGGSSGASEVSEIRSALRRMQDLVAKTADFSGKGGA